MQDNRMTTALVMEEMEDDLPQPIYFLKIPQFGFMLVEVVVVYSVGIVLVVKQPGRNLPPLHSEMVAMDTTTTLLREAAEEQLRWYGYLSLVTVSFPSAT